MGFTTDFEGDNFSNIKQLQMQGKAAPVTDKEEADRAMELILTKFPQMKNMPPNPGMRIIRVKLTEGYILDYTVAFMHRDPVKY